MEDSLCQSAYSYEEITKKKGVHEEYVVKFMVIRTYYTNPLFCFLVYVGWVLDYVLGWIPCISKHLIDAVITDIHVQTLLLRPADLWNLS